MDKILVAFILGIIVCLAIIFDFFDKLILLSILIGIYEFTKYDININKYIIIKMSSS